MTRRAINTLHYLNRTKTLASNDIKALVIQVNMKSIAAHLTYLTCVPLIYYCRNIRQKHLV